LSLAIDFINLRFSFSAQETKFYFPRSQ